MSPRHSRNPDTITMYGADWCGDCIRAKAFFDEHAMSFDYVDLVEFPDETDVVLEHNGGVQKIPLVIYPDSSFQIEPTNDELETKRLELNSLITAGADATGAEHQIIENASAGRFELHIDGAIISVADYSENEDGAVVVPHVTTDPEKRGNGYATQLMNGVLEQLRASDRKIVPVCTFAARHMRQNPQHQDLLT